MIAGFGNVEIAALIQRNTGREIQLRLRRLPAIATGTISIARNGRNYTSAEIEPTNALIARICNQQVAALIQDKSDRNIQLRLHRTAAIAAEARNACTSNRGDDASRTDFANAVIVGVGNVEVARTVYHNSVWFIHCCIDGQSAIATRTQLPVARDRTDLAGAGDFANAMVAFVSNIEIPSGVSGNGFRRTKLHGDSGAAFSIEPLSARACHRVQAIRRRVIHQHRFRGGISDHVPGRHRYQAWPWQQPEIGKVPR